MEQGKTGQFTIHSINSRPTSTRTRARKHAHTFTVSFDEQTKGVDGKVCFHASVCRGALVEHAACIVDEHIQGMTTGNKFPRKRSHGGCVGHVDHVNNNGLQSTWE